MKRTQFIQLLHNIKESIVSFISIMVFILLSIALFLGLGWGSDAIKENANRDFLNYKLHDYDISMFVGVDQNDVDDFPGMLQYIDESEGYYKTCESFEFNGERKQVQISSITTKIDQLYDVTGVLPDKDNEIAIERTWAKENNIQLGDTIDVNPDEIREDPNKHYFKAPLTSQGAYHFKITAFVSSVANISSNPSTYGSSKEKRTPINCLMFVSPTACDITAFSGFTNVLLRSNSFNEYAFYSREYSSRINNYYQKVDYVASEIADRHPGPPELLYKQNTLTREQCPSLGAINMSCQGSKNLRFSLSISLLVIALLICYTVVTRLTSKQAKEIGTKKALGFTNFEICKSFLCFTGFSALLGAIGGFLVGRFIIEPIAFSQMKNNFLLHSTIMESSFIEPFVIGIAIVAFIALVTFLSVRRALKNDALTLLADKIDSSKGKKRAYEKTKLWKKMPLVTRTIVSNFVNEKKRIISTLIGIVGVTTLLTCGFTFSNNVGQSNAIHFSQYQMFDQILYYDSSVPDCESKIISYLNEENIKAAPVISTSGAMSSVTGNEVAQTALFISGDDVLVEQMYNFYAPNNQKISLANSFLACESLLKACSLKVNDMYIYIDETEGLTFGFVSQAFKSYLGKAMCFMSKDYYEQAFQTYFEGNAFIFNSNGKDLTSLNNKLKTVDGYLMTDNYKEAAGRSLKQVSGSFTIMSVIYIFMSITMAFLVILNLLVTFVAAKKREIITLLVNGYSINVAKRYIYSDTIVLTILSIILGSIFGTLVGFMAIKSVSVYTIIFPLSISWIAILISSLGTALLVALVTFISLRKINKYELTDIA